jgi:serine/threonine-protein kinase
MEFPIPVGTVLRQRYLIQQILGQGGFGRTYLVLDQERFNEACVLKEFLVPYQQQDQLEKSKALFHREANILHQIQHPQIPRFWAAFEQDNRLFLVQDWIQGQTYRQQLSDRTRQGLCFSELEVLHFLQHLLPVLTYIHERDIIHRDITPENVMLRSQSASPTAEPNSDLSSGLPVLIDFGAVKAATTYSATSSMTRVGKVGYAPPEQLQTGRVYPNSDLYSLAASSLVLLTGREPRQLLDGHTLTWQWQSHTSTSETLTKILRRMLAIYPSDRYQTAREVLADLQPLLATTIQEAEIPSSRTPGAAPVKLLLPPLPNQPARASNTPSSTTFSSPEAGGTFAPELLFYPEKKRKPGVRSGIGLGIAAGVAIGMGIAVPLLWEAWTGAPQQNSDVWVSGARLPQSEVSRIIGTQRDKSSNSALKSPGISLPGSFSNGQPQMIQFAPGEISTTLQGTLQDSTPQTYVLDASQGQIMIASLEGAEVTMNLLRSDQEAIDAAAYRTRNWTGQLPASDRYLIQVAGSGDYSLEVAITPLSRPTQEQTQRISFARGRTSTTVTGQLAPNQIRRYLLRAEQAQILVLKVLQGSVSFSIIAPDGQRIGGSATDAKNWQGRTPLSGDYVIEVSTQKMERFALSMEIF